MAASASLALLAGCASPGPPLPPSLKLPQVVTDLKAERVGNQVTLRWTTPSRTTDKLLLKDEVTAEVCRNAGAAPPPATGRPRSRTVVGSPPCPAALRVRVMPGEKSLAADTLSEPLTAGAPSLLTYRVQILNAAGRTAGPSAPAYAATGAAPDPVEAFRATSQKPGVVLEWSAESPANPSDSVELDRTTVAPQPRPPAKPGQLGSNGTHEPKNLLAAAPAAPAEIHLRAGGDEDSSSADAGGTLDRTVQIDHTYTYTAQRVRSVVLGAQHLEVRSAASPQVTVAVRNAFPPEAPTGLVAAPGFVGAGDAARPTIDLSWEPNDEPRIAGYRVYRRDLGANGTGEWHKISGEELIRVPAFRDVSVTAGQQYGYRVIAVGDNGIESAPGNEITETAPSR